METIDKIRAEIERRITDNTFGAKLELIDILAWLDTLESERPEPYNPVYDEAYLNEKIKKATESWKGVDVDAMLAECRGYDEEKSEKQNQDELKKEIEAQLSIFPYTKVSPELPESRGIVIRKELYMFARHFAKWGAEHSGSSEIPNDLEEAARRYGFEEYMRRCNGGEYGTSEDAFIAGAKWDREQMMKEAVEGEYDSYPAAIYLEHPIPRTKNGDKIRIIIVKE